MVVLNIMGMAGRMAKAQQKTITRDHLNPIFESALTVWFLPNEECGDLKLLLTCASEVKLESQKVS